MRRVTTFARRDSQTRAHRLGGKAVAHFAVQHKDSWVNLPKTDAIKLLKGAPRSRRDDAADRGSAIHATVEAYLQDRPLPDGLTEDRL